MADGAVILGVTGILTTGILGPIVAHHIQKDRETRTDHRVAIDEATDALVRASSRLAAGAGQTFSSASNTEERRAGLDALQEDLFAVEGHSLKLEMRLGERSLTDAYKAAGGAMVRQGEVLWDNLHGKYAKLEDVRRELEEADRVWRGAYEAFLRSARAWHQETGL
jgi:hypothetical protein